MPEISTLLLLVPALPLAAAILTAALGPHVLRGRSHWPTLVALAGSTAWKPKTVKTLLNRLVQKKALGFQRQGRAYRYFPLVDEQACVRAESRTFLRRVYGGALAPMLAAFLEEQELSPGEIADLRRILDEKQEE